MEDISNLNKLMISMKQIGVKIFAKLNIFLSIFFLYVYFVVLQEDFDCSCKGQTGQCAAYIALPCLVLTVFFLWADKPFQREWRYVCTCSRFKCNKFLLSLFTHFLKAMSFGLLWVECVLIDGDWYVCCRNDGSEKQAKLACTAVYRYSSEEKAIVAQLKSNSRAQGISLIALVSLVVAIWFSLDWKRILSICWGDRMNLKIELHRLILEENEYLLSVKLKKAVKDKLSQKLTRYVDEERWDQCFDVADELIKESSEQREDKANGTETKTSSDQPSPQNTDRDQPGPSSKESIMLHEGRSSEHFSSGAIEVDIQMPTETDPLKSADS